MTWNGPVSNVEEDVPYYRTDVESGEDAPDGDVLEDDPGGTDDDSAAESGIDGRPARTTAAASVIAAAAVALTLGVALDVAVPVGLGVLGAVCFGAAARELDRDSRQRRALGSLAAVVGTVLLGGAVGLGFAESGTGLGLVVTTTAVGVSILAIDAAVGIDRERRVSLSESLRQNGNVVLVGVVYAALVHVVFVYDLVPAAFVASLRATTPNALFALVTVQLLAIGAGLAVGRAASILDRWVPDEDATAVLGSIDAVGIEMADVPRAYRVFLAVQFVAAVVPSTRRLFDLFFGAILGPVLTSGVLHAPLLLVIGVSLAVVAGQTLQRWTIAWFGDDPGEVLAMQAGGIAAVGLASLVGLALAVVPVAPFGGVLTGRSSIVGLPAVALGGLALVLLTGIALLNAVTLVEELDVLPAPATGVAFGSAALFLAVVAGAAGDVAPVLVFACVAGTILAWDLGAHAASVGRQLGARATTDRVEFVHVSASAVVLAAAAAVATVAHYVVVPVIAPAGGRATAGAATLGMVLLLGSVLAFVVAAALRQRGTDADPAGSERPRID